MGDVVNLNRFRKRKREQEAKRRADENAARRGRTKAQRAAEHERRAKQEAELDGARCEKTQEEDEPPSDPSLG